MKILDTIKKILPDLVDELIPGAGIIRTIAGAIAGTDNEAEAVAKIEADPRLALELQKAVLTYAVDMSQTEVEKLKVQVDKIRAENEALVAVNETMRAEAKSEHWPQYLWRPYNGVLYGTTVFAVYFILPVFKRIVPVVPLEVWVGWGAILGVTAWHRGRLQRAESGEVTKPGLVARTVAALKGNKS